MANVFIRQFMLLYLIPMELGCASSRTNIEITRTSGIIFERLPDIIYPSKVWNFVLRYKFDNFIEDISAIDKLIVDFEHQAHYISKVYSEFDNEMKLIKDSVKSYLDTVDQILYFLPKIKTIQYVNQSVSDNSLTFLSGDVSREQMDDLNNKINLVNKGSEGAHFLRDHLTILNKMEEQVSNDSSILKSCFINFLNYTYDIDVASLKGYDELNTVQIFSDLSDYLHQIESYLALARFQLFDFEKALTSTFEGKLSVKLFKPTMLEEMINELTPNLHFLSFPKQETFEHYSLAKVSSGINGSSLLIFVELPLINHEEKFKAFIPHSHPVFDKSIQSWLQIDVKPVVFLTTMDEEYYSIISLSDYNSCKHTSLSLCYSSNNILRKHIPNCLMDLYNNKTDNCDYFIVEQRIKPYLSRIHNGIIFSTQADDVLYVDCPYNNQLNQLMIGNMWNVIPINGHGLVKNYAECIILSRESSQKIRPTLIKKHGNFHEKSLIVPSLKWDLPDIVTLNIESTLDALTELNKSELNDSKGISIKYLKQILEERQENTRTIYICILATTGFLALLLLISILSMYIYHRRQKVIFRNNIRRAYVLERLIQVGRQI